ncbi:MAG: hypothetical protein JWQ74_3260, partial [Marmoricola sp.]|nr:hypothetical protein [Marmoricola sp.]
MATLLDDPAPTTHETGSRALRTSLYAGVLLVAVAMAIPPLFDWNVRIESFPPLNAAWDPKVGQGTLPALLIAALATWRAAQVAAVLPWRQLLLATWTTGVLWMVSLATIEGWKGIGGGLNGANEYLPTARVTDDFAHTLKIFVSMIPDDAKPYHWPAHIAGHPPGALGFFVLLSRLGLGSTIAAGAVVTVLAATTAVAVLVTVRALGAEALARRAAPFLVLGPAAIWQCASGDAMFAAFAAWGLACLAIAASRTRTGPALCWSALAGLLLGATVMLSYGLLLMGLPALVVLFLARSWRPLVPTALAALAVVLAFAAYGFNWLAGYRDLHDRYWIGIAHQRSGWYWTWANLAVLVCSAGLIAAPALAAAWGRRRDSDPQVRTVALLCGAGIAMVLAADVSQMSRAEVERIWLPFAPWLLLSCALLPDQWRRRGLVLQLGVALVVQH